MENEIGTPVAADARVMVSELAHARSTVKFAFKTAMMGAVAVSALSFMTNGALAACDTATITGTCTDLVLPSAAGNVDYTIASGATVNSSNSDPNGNIRAVEINSTIGSFTNNGYVTGGGANEGFVATGAAIINGNFINNGTIYTEDDQALIFNSGATLNGNFVNNGRIEAFSNDSGTDRWVYSIIFQKNTTINGTFTNSATGVITGNSNHPVEVDTFIREFNNEGLISHTASDDNNWGPAVGLFTGHIGVFNNSGIMTDSSTPLYGWPSGSLLLASNWQTPDLGSMIDTLNNSGEMSVTNPTYANSAITVRDKSSIGTINNTGRIWTTGANYFGIENRGAITRLNNFQGTTGSYGSALTYGGILPTYYNMIAYGDQYGQLAVANADHQGTLTFGVSGGDAASGVSPSQLKRKTYVDVMTGVNVANINNAWAKTTTGDHRAFGAYDGLLWMLREHQEDYSWNLEVLDSADTFFNASATAVNQQMSDLQGMVDTGAGSAYECQMGTSQSACVSVKGGYVSQGDGASNGAATVMAGLRLNSRFKAGAFLQQGFSYDSPDDLEYSSTMPSLGGFLAFSQNDDDTGIQAKSSVAVSQGEAKISRENLLGNSRMASGTADIDGYALAQTFGYGIGIDNMSVMTPYVGIGYVSSTRSNYKEDSDVAGIDDAFDFSSYGQQATIGAVGLAYELDNHDGFTLRAGAGLSYVLNSDADDLEATSNVPGIETLSAESAYDQTGDVGMTGYLGSDYAITENQRIGFDASAWRSVSTGDYGYGVMAGWTMSFGEGEQSLGK